MKNLLLGTLMSLMLTMSVYCDELKFQSDGLYGGSIYFTLPADEGWTAFGRENIYYSHDCKQWEFDRILDENLKEIISDGSTLYAITEAVDAENKLMMSTDGAWSWTNISQGLPSGTYKTFIYLGPDNTLWTACSRTLYHRTEGSSSWEEVYTFPSESEDYYLLCAAVKGDAIAIGTQIGVYNSTDGGEHWQLNSDGIDLSHASNSIKALAFNSISLFAATNDGIYCSPDSGYSWQMCSTKNMKRNTEKLIATDGFVMAISMRGAVVSNDAGNSWSEVTDDNVYDAIFHNAKIIISTRAGIFVSEDNGVTFNSSMDGIAEVRIDGVTENSDYMFCWSSGIGLYRLEGEEWKKVSRLPFVVNDFIVHDDALHIGSLWYGYYYSTDNGESWETVPEDKVWDPDIKAVAIDSNNATYLGTHATVFRSTDDRETWIDLFENFSGSVITYDIEVSSNNDIYIALHKGLFVIYNDATTISTKRTGLGSSNIARLAADANNNIFAIDYDGYIYRTDNTMSSWEKLECLYPLTDLFYGKDCGLVAKCDQGILQSTNSGSSWIELTDNYNTDNCDAMFVSSDNYLFLSHGTELLKSLTPISTISVDQPDEVKTDVLSVEYLGQGMYNINFEEFSSGTTDIRAFDLFGRCCLHITNNSAKGDCILNMQNYSEGVYFISVENKSGMGRTVIHHNP